MTDGALDQSTRILDGESGGRGHPLAGSGHVEEVAPDVAFVSSFANVSALRTAGGLVLFDSGSQALSEQVHDQLLAEHDYVIIDAPPLLLVTDGAVLSELAHGTLLVVASGQTPRSALAGAVAQLEGIGSEVSGIVVTKVPTKGPDSYAYGAYGAYGAYYGTDEAGNPTTEYRKIGTGQMPIVTARKSRNSDS